jgi:hypothetical protein
MNRNCQRCMEWGDFCSARCAETAADTLPDRPEAANDTGVYAKTSWEEVGKTVPNTVHPVDGVEDETP